MIQEFRQDKKTQATPPPEDPEAQLFEQIQQARHDPYPLEGAHGVHEIPETYENLDEYIESDEYVPEQDHFYGKFCPIYCDFGVGGSVRDK